MPCLLGLKELKSTERSERKRTRCPTLVLILKLDMFEDSVRLCHSYPLFIRISTWLGWSFLLSLSFYYSNFYIPGLDARSFPAISHPYP